MDAVVGLLHLREFQTFRIYATPSVRRILLEENTIFRVLNRALPPVAWQDIPSDSWFPAHLDTSGGADDFNCRAIDLGGGYPDYVSAKLRAELPPEVQGMLTRLMAQLILEHADKSKTAAMTEVDHDL